MNQLRCYTCLQLGRNLRPLTAYAKYLFTVLCPEMFYKSKANTEFQICWECEHMAAKIRSFQKKLKKGNNILKQSLKGTSTIIEGLSSHMITKVEIIDIQPQNLPQERPQNLPIVPQQLPIIPQQIPIVPQILPIVPQIGQLILPTGPQNLPIILQRPPILPQNILELSLKDMLEAPSKIHTETEIKLEMDDEQSSSDFLDEDPLSSLRSLDQQKQWVQVELPPLTKSIKEEMLTPETSIAQNVFPEAQTPLRGFKEAVKVTVTGPDKAEGSTSKICDIDEALAKCQKKNYLLTKLLSNPTKGEELFVMTQNQDPSSSKNDSEPKNRDPYTEDAAKLIILSDAEVEERRKKKRSNNAFITSQYKCEKCIQYYFTQEKMDQHNLKHDESQGNSICGICEQRFIDDNSLNEHYKQHFIVYECLKCPYRHSNRASLTYHIRSNHEESKFFCKKCSEVFKTYKERRRHIEIAHDQKLACKMCTKTFVNATKLKMHEYQVHNDNRVSCPICKNNIKKYYLKTHLKTHKELDDRFFCADCGTFYKSKATYELHIKNSLKHNSLENLNLKCDHCDKYFRTKESFRNHLREIGGLHYTCDYCNRNLKSRKQLVGHIRNTHMKILQKSRPPKMRICEHCGKSFTIKKSLVEHVNRHLGIRPHVCKDCGATFIYAAALFTHRRLVHKVKRKYEMTS